MRKSEKNAPRRLERVYVYHGADDRLKRNAVEQLIADVIDPDYRDFDCENLYGPDVTSDRVMTAAAMVPFASSRHLVIISQADDIPTAEQQTIAGRLGNIPESGCVVFVTPAPEMQDGRPVKRDELHPELLKAIKKLGKAVDFPLVREQEAVRLVYEMAKEAGKIISSTAAAAVVRRSGSDTGILASEVAKLVNYVGDADRIVDQDVEEVTTETAEEKIFALMDAIGSKSTSTALTLLFPFIRAPGADAQKEALKTLSMLARHFRQLWQARTLIDRGCRTIAPGAVPEEMLGVLPSDNILKLKDWQLKKLAQQARNFTLDDLERSFDKMARTDLSIKGAEEWISDPALAMEMLVTELSGKR